MASPEATSEQTFRLDDYACLQIAGEDAESFLQGQLSNDLTALPVGGGQLSTFNDPQGRVIALLRMFRTPNAFIAAMPTALAGVVAGRLRMFVMRSRVSIDSETRWRLTGIAGERALPGPGRPAMKMPAAKPLWITLQDEPPEADAGTEGQWQALETMNGIPEVYAETSGRFVAQMLRLDRLGAVSFTKGCYVGQEVIARAHHLGRVKRHTRLYRCAGAAAAPGDPVMGGPDRVGEVARVAEVAESRIVMAVVRDGTEEPVTIAGTALERLPDPKTFG
jgi:folate-binding protein YgfZ